MPDDLGSPDENDTLDEVVFSRVGSVGHLLLNRPRKLNAVTPRMTRLIDRYMAEAMEDPLVKSVVISGAGSKGFCSGADLGTVAEGNADLLSTEAGGFAGIVQFPRTKPLIGAVHGHTVAGGFEIAIACDLLIAEESASFALPEIARGLIANGGGLTRLPRQLPVKVAYDMALTGRVLSSQEAKEMGIISRLVPVGSALAVAIAIGEEIGSRATAVVDGTLRILRAVTEGESSTPWELSTAIARGIRTGTNAREHAHSFVSDPS